MKRKMWTLLGVIVMVGVMVLPACQSQTVIVEKEVTRIVTEKEVIERPVEVTRQVTRIVTLKETVQVEITATPTAIPQGGFLNLTSPVDADILNPLFAGDSASGEIVSYLFASPFITDPWTGETAPHLVESWDWSDGNKTVVYHVRQGMLWSDGEPITAHDAEFTFKALMAKDEAGHPVLADSPYVDMVEDVETVELIDDYTLRVTFSEPLCANLDRMSLPWLPSHVYLADPGFEWADLVEHESNWQPTVFSGPFMLEEWLPDDHITLTRNPNYWQGAPYLDGIRWQVVLDEDLEREMLKNGASDIAGIDPRYLTEMEQVEHLDIYKFLDTAYDCIGLQQGDPQNPQPRLNSDGSVNSDHGSHPILGEVEVRQALAYALDRTAIINKVHMGKAVPLHAHIIPLYRWAYNDELEPRAYDPERAGQMLDAAGWVLNPESGIRECQGCGTTPDGTPMRLTVQTNAKNEIHEDVIVLIQEQWSNVGIDVEIEAVQWESFLDTLMSQAFDVVVSTWREVDVDNEALFFARYDVPGGGFNFCSFYRPDYEQLELEAKAVEGCSYADRGAIYREIQEMLHDEQPYIWLYTPRTIVGIHRRIGGVNPAPWSITYNIHEWFIKSE